MRRRGGRFRIDKHRKRSIKRESTDLTQLSSLKILQLESIELGFKEHLAFNKHTEIQVFFFFFMLTLSKYFVSYELISVPSSGSKNYKY